MRDSIVHKLSKSPLLLELLGSLLTLLDTIEFVKAINDDLAIGLCSMPYFKTFPGQAMHYNLSSHLGLYIY